MAPQARPVLRRCVACRQLRDRQELFRVVRLWAGGGLALDRGMGRSAYLCPEVDCLEEARRKRRLQRALRCAVDDTILKSLEQRLPELPPLRQDDQWPQLGCGSVATLAPPDRRPE
ncbi:MAG: YlxR family protein [Cyanobacteriota bacterium]|nr:YlxR family protein [Cyanobacteriota bacterium]